MVSDRKLIIFDLDGTLVDSSRDIATSINFSLEQLGEKTHRYEEIFPGIGKPLVKIFMDLIGDGDMAQAEQACEVYRKHFFDHCADKSRLYPGVRETLGQFNGEYRLAVATAKQTFMAVRVVELLELEDRFDRVMGTDGFPSKPDPEILLRLLKEFDTPAGSALMIGDTTSDILAAKSAGMFSCAVNYGNGDAQALAEVGPDFQIDAFSEIGPLIDGIWRD